MAAQATQPLLGIRGLNGPIDFVSEWMVKEYSKY